MPPKKKVKQEKAEPDKKAEEAATKSEKKEEQEPAEDSKETKDTEMKDTDVKEEAKKDEAVKDEDKEDKDEGKEEVDKEEDKDKKSAKEEVKTEDDKENEDDEDEDDSNEEEEEPEETEEGGRGKRKRKSYSESAFEPEDFTMKEQPSVRIIKGRGKTLKDMPSVVESIKRSSDDITFAHRFLYGKRGGKLSKKEMTSNILAFSGYLKLVPKGYDEKKLDAEDEEVEVSLPPRCTSRVPSATWSAYAQRSSHPVSSDCVFKESF